MSEQTPFWAERLVKSNEALAGAIALQTKSINALSAAITQMVAMELDDDPPPQTYMDGTPR